MRPATALADDEPVLTPDGWVRIADLRAGDLVATVDGSFTDVVGVYPQGERDLFRVTFNDGTSVRTDADHLWTTTTRAARKCRRPAGVRTTAEIARTLTFARASRCLLQQSPFPSDPLGHHRHRHREVPRERASPAQVVGCIEVVPRSVRFPQTQKPHRGPAGLTRSRQKPQSQKNDTSGLR